MDENKCDERMNEWVNQWYISEYMSGWESKWLGEDVVRFWQMEYEQKWYTHFLAAQKHDCVILLNLSLPPPRNMETF